MATTQSVRTVVAIAYNEVLLNSKRVAPYVLMILFGVLGWMTWSKGPAVSLGWATNSDFYIARALKGFSFIFGVPIFNAMIMGDPVIRDFRIGIDPLVFSKPLSRAQYLFGKFFGNFFVLTCCMAAFPVAMFALQVFRPSQMVVQSFKVLPYLSHFLFFVVITQLSFAAFFFMVGALTRNNKIVYIFAICSYPVFISLLVFLFGAWGRGKILFDPFLLNTGPSQNGFGHSADYLNQYVYTYTSDMILNRLGLILFAVGCVTWLYLRFTTAERSRKLSVTSLGLSKSADIIHYQNSSGVDEFSVSACAAVTEVTKLNRGFPSTLNKLLAAFVVEIRLLGAERSLVVVIPLAIFLSVMEVAFYRIPSDVSHSAAYATNTANLLMLFLIGITVFYTGEAVHRDRELNIEPVVWSTPVSNNVLLLSKILTTMALTLSLVVVVGLTAVVIQLIKRDTPVNLSAYATVYGVVLIPGVIFLASIVVTANALLRNKYATYVLAVGTGVALFYLYNLGYNHWLYNPLLYHLWKFDDLTSGWTLTNRLYWLMLAVACLFVARLFFERKSN